MAVMSDAPDTRIVTSDCVAWSTKGNGKPEGGADSKPVDVRKDTVVTVYGVSVETEPRSLLVRMQTESGERSIEIRERFLHKPTQ
jgi:hypothetical protein